MVGGTNGITVPNNDGNVHYDKLAKMSNDSNTNGNVHDGKRVNIGNSTVGHPTDSYIFLVSPIIWALAPSTIIFNGTPTSLDNFL